MGTDSKERLIRLLNLTASDNDHEALLALRNAQKVMDRSGMTWESLVTSGRSPLSRSPPSASAAKRNSPPSKTQAKAPPEPKGKAARAKYLRLLRLFEFIFAQQLTLKQTEFFEGLRAAWVRFGSLTVRQNAALESTCIAKGF